LRQQLDEAIRQQQAQQESSFAEQSRIEARTQELHAAQAWVGEQVKRIDRNAGPGKSNAGKVPNDRRARLASGEANWNPNWGSCGSNWRRREINSKRNRKILASSKTKLEARSQELQVGAGRGAATRPATDRKVWPRKASVGKAPEQQVGEIGPTAQ